MGTYDGSLSCHILVHSNNAVILLLSVPDAVRDIALVFDAASGVYNPDTRVLNISVTITWLPPPELYGVIQEYSVTVQDSLGVTIFQDISASPSLTSVTATIQVSPFEGYSVTVNVTTGGGLSSNTSSSITSPETGEELLGRPYVLVLFFLCSETL